MLGSESVILSLRKVRKAFGGVHAVWDCSLDVLENSIHAIIGPNGAGKTTLLGLIAGEIRPDSGRILLFGSDVTNGTIRKRSSMGLNRAYQTPNLFANLTVQENLFLAWSSGDFSAPKMSRLWLHCKHILEQTEETAEIIGLSGRLHVQASDLSHGEQRRLGIGMAMANYPRLLLLDEPAAGLVSAERVALANLIRELSERENITILFVDHDTSFVSDLAEVVTIMYQGHVFITGTPSEVERNQGAQEIYYGAGKANNV